MNTELNEIKIREAGTNRQWRTFKAEPATLWQERWHKGRRQVRVIQCKTLPNPHKPSHWRVAGYLGRNDAMFDTAKEATASYE